MPCMYHIVRNLVVEKLGGSLPKNVLVEKTVVDQWLCTADQVDNIVGR